MQPWMVALCAALVSSAPSGPPVLPGAVTLSVGEQRVFRVGCRLQRLAVDRSAGDVSLQRLAVGDPSVYDVKALGNDEVQLIGATEGRSTLLGWCSDGRRITTLVTVVSAPRPAPPVTSSVQATTSQALVVDAQGVREAQVTLLEFAADLREVTRVEETDGGLVITGLDASGRRVTVTASPRRARPPDSPRGPGGPVDAGSDGRGGGGRAGAGGGGEDGGRK